MASATNVNSRFMVILPRVIIDSAPTARKATPGELVGSNNRPMPMRGGTPPMAARSADRYFELKSEIHRKLIGVLNLERVSSLPKDRVRAEIGRVVDRLLPDQRVPMTTLE